jgi:hypothetical protein
MMADMRDPEMPVAAQPCIHPFGSMRDGFVYHLNPFYHVVILLRTRQICTSLDVSQLPSRTGSE